MASPSIIATTCPHCQARFKVSPEFVGRRAKCPACKQGFVVTAAAAPKPKPTVASQVDAKSEYITIACKLCETRYAGRPSQLGHKLPCPDCGTLNTLVRGKPAPQPVRPAALDGDQYELWEGDNQPWGAALASEEPETVLVRCELCDSIQHVGTEMIGQQSICPDCGHETKVRPAKPKQPTGPQPVRRSDDLQVEPATQLPTEDNSDIYSRIYLADPPDDEEMEKRIRLVATDKRARNKIPDKPLLTGYSSFVRSPGWIQKFVSLAGWLAVTHWILIAALLVATVPLGIIPAMFMMMTAIFVFGLVFAAGSACAITTVTESSEGNDQIENWPTANPIDWMGETFFVVIAFGAAGLPGGVLGWLAQEAPAVAVVLTAVSLLLFFPVTLLSTLEYSSPFVLLAPGVLGSFFRAGGTWILFYILSGICVAVITGCLVVTVGLAVWSPLASAGLAVLTAPIAVLAMAFYFRMMGRMAWRMRIAQA